MPSLARKIKKAQAREAKLARRAAERQAARDKAREKARAEAVAEVGEARVARAEESLESFLDNITKPTPSMKAQGIAVDVEAIPTEPETTEPEEEPVMSDRPTYNGHRASPVISWAHALRAHPHKWAKYPYKVNGTVTAALKKGNYAGGQPGESGVFDAVMRMGYLYARCLVEGTSSDYPAYTGDLTFTDPPPSKKPGGLLGKTDPPSTSVTPNPDPLQTRSLAMPDPMPPINPSPEESAAYCRDYHQNKDRFMSFLKEVRQKTPGWYSYDRRVPTSVPSAVKDGTKGICEPGEFDAHSYDTTKGSNCNGWIKVFYLGEPGIRAYQAEKGRSANLVTQEDLSEAVEKALAAQAEVLASLTKTTQDNGPLPPEPEPDAMPAPSPAIDKTDLDAFDTLVSRLKVEGFIDRAERRLLDSAADEVEARRKAMGDA